MKVSDALATLSHSAGDFAKRNIPGLGGIQNNFPAQPDVEAQATSLQKTPYLVYTKQSHREVSNTQGPNPSVPDHRKNFQAPPQSVRGQPYRPLHRENSASPSLPEPSVRGTLRVSRDGKKLKFARYRVLSATESQSEPTAESVAESPYATAVSRPPSPGPPSDAEEMAVETLITPPSSTSALDPSDAVMIDPSSAPVREHDAVPSFLMDLDPDPVSLSTPTLTSTVLRAPGLLSADPPAVPAPLDHTTPTAPTHTTPNPDLLSVPRTLPDAHTPHPPAVCASINQTMPTAPTSTPPNPGSSVPPTLPDAHTLHSPTSLNQSPIPHQSYTAARPHTRPSPLPEVLESVIHRAVTERLDSTTTHLVESTVRGVVDACVPRLEEFINAKLACLTTRNVGNSDGWDGDDEDDDMLVLPRKKRPGARGHMNYLHSAFRRYLEQKGLMNTRTSTVRNPRMPDPSQVQSFNQDGGSPPTIQDIAIDWKSPLKTSPWNKEVLRLLATDFRSEIQSGLHASVTYDAHTMTVDSLSRICLQKLSRTHQAYRQQAIIDSSNNEQARVDAIAQQQSRKCAQRKNDRLTARKHGTLARRRKIARENRSRDPPTWDAIIRMLDCLGVEGMSGDETDSRAGAFPKVLRRIETPWISPIISRLFQAVESYGPSLVEENMREHIGNALLSRHFEPRRKNTLAKPLPGLPRNWYSDEWFRGLSTGCRAVLAPKDDVEFPKLEPYGQLGACGAGPQ